ncbi:MULTISPECIES: hypothetical protein [Sphingobium]|uniref:Uncharacterized protein n=1 Tax=Sphingobium cupriresistens LL01 TaxID=1420583 RepID=A0A0J8AXE5_9SPHN|nr:MULTISPECIES: hypothetical protein [Sphingobium]KMS58855.1 hypothetical protein V473_10275 [Sphingobium cupriresistens LL01]MBJ7377893.1 hypothetical protein [Sphingobium sp.]WCP11932.1 hypothetical protein sphantq_00327 [Sphingobium sp. AntQ-1]
MRVLHIISSLALSLPVPTWAQANACKAQEDAVNDVAQIFAKDQSDLNDRSNSIQGDAGKAELSGTVDIKMVEQRWVFDIPTVIMKTKAMALDIPQVTMNLRTLSWDNPTVVMRAKKVGQYPEFKCSGGLIPKCTVKWKDIITHVPVTEMRRQEIKMHIPETRMERTDFTMDIPEIHPDRKEWFVKIPEVTLRNIIVEAEKLKERGDALGADAMALANRQKEVAAERTAALFQCHVDSLQTKRLEVASQFDTVLNSIDSAIDTIRKNGGNPSKIVTDAGGPPFDMLAQRLDLIAKRDAALAQIDNALAAMQKDEVLQIDKTIA